MGISVGILGVGGFGSAFVPLFNAHPLVSRIALCDRERSRAAIFANAPAYQKKMGRNGIYASLDEMCRSDLDAIAIYTQPWLHAPQAIQAMEAGKCVFSAVPIIMLPDGDEILEWCDRLVNTCRRTGMSYMLGETTYYKSQAIYCRRKAAEGAFGDFVYAEGEYFHDVDDPDCNLRNVKSHREGSSSGREWVGLARAYLQRGVLDGPMHYPTHSTGGPISVMKAHAVKVSAFGYRNRNGDPYFADSAFSNETALFQMSNGAAMRICEYRDVGHREYEIFRVFGTKGSFRENTWVDKRPGAWKEQGPTVPMTPAEMRDPLPPEVEEAYKDISTVVRHVFRDGEFRPELVDAPLGEAGIYRGHGGSHSYLVHEFVESAAQERQPAINVWEAVRYMAPGVMAHKSAMKDGELLAVPDWGDAPAPRGKFPAANEGSVE